MHEMEGPRPVSPRTASDCSAAGACETCLRGPRDLAESSGRLSSPQLQVALRSANFSRPSLPELRLP